MVVLPGQGRFTTALTWFWNVISLHCDPPVLQQRVLQPHLLFWQGDLRHLLLWPLQASEGNHSNPQSKLEVTLQLLLEACEGLLRPVEAQCRLQVNPKGSSLEPTMHKAMWEGLIQDPTTHWIMTHSLKNPVLVYYGIDSDNCITVAMGRFVHNI